MGWLRDNWLDALIFLLFALVVAGVVLFLTGVNPFARPPAQTTPSPVPQTSTPNPVVTPQNPQPSEVVIPVLPRAPEETPPAQTQTTPRNPTPTNPDNAQRPTPAPPQVTPDSPAASSGNWRIAVGAFSDAQNASRLGQTLQSQGYQVRLEPSGNLTRVVIGPFPSEEQARAVAQNLSQYETRVYRGTASASSRPVTNQSPASSTTPRSAYLQVGAFRNPASAENLVSQLREAGYPVVLARDGELVRVRVGPVSGDRLEETKTALRGLGLSPLEVR